MGRVRRRRGPRLARHGTRATAWPTSGFFAAAAIVWVLVGLVVTTRDPVADPGAGFVGAALIGLAIALTLVPLVWLAVFSRHRMIAFRGDWLRAIRRVGLGRASWWPC